MTFTEYMNQESIEYHPPWTVLITGNESDIQVHYHYPYITLSMNYHGEHFHYLVDRETGILWTQDEDWNKKSPSCFRLSMDKINI